MYKNNTVRSMLFYTLELARVDCRGHRVYLYVIAIIARRHFIAESSVLCFAVAAPGARAESRKSITSNGNARGKRFIVNFNAPEFRKSSDVRNTANACTTLLLVRTGCNDIIITFGGAIAKRCTIIIVVSVGQGSQRVDQG